MDLLRYKRIVASFILLVIGVTFLSPVGVLAQDQVVDEVVTLRVDGPIVPVVAQYLDRGIEEAERRGAVCVVELNTPGGLYDITQKIVQRILDAKVPVVIYVSPAGGAAGSAGAYITVAAHVAAMAPGTRIGAATPIAGGGEEMPETQEEKIVQDAAAWIRSIAEMRDRNAEKAELMVTEGRSFTDSEALEYDLIDLKAADLDELLAAVDEMTVILGTGEEVVLSTANVSPEQKDMTRAERILHVLSNPNIAYILLSVGMLGLLLEFYNPGSIFPGAVGGLSLIVALYSLGTLDASWSGVLLIVLGFFLFAMELFVASFGLLTAGGLVAVVVGSLMLFSGSPTGIGVDYGVIAGVVVSVGAFVIFAVQAVIKAQRCQATTGREGMVGAGGVALTALDPKGTVLFDGERWRARAEEGSIGVEEEVVVVRVEGLTLVVRHRSEP
jgi:membrane-bound serine protease (ClpP class)